MAIQRYSLVAHDWLNLEYIINDLTRRVAGQDLSPISSPTFVALTLSGLTASQAVMTDANKKLVSVDYLNQAVKTTSSPTFAKLFLPTNVEDSVFKAGGFEIQSYAVNNSWIGENVYYKDSDISYKYRANGFGIVLVMGDGQLDVRTMVNGLAGANATDIRRLNVANNGVVTLNPNITVGNTPELKIGGYRTADAYRTLEIGVGIDAADTVSFDGLSNYLFDGNIIGANVTSGINPGHTHTSVAMANMLPVFNIKDYGAVGDNSTECATAIQNAIDAAEAVSGTVYVPEGTYKFSTGLTITAGIKFIGSSKNGSILKKYGNIVGININAGYVILDSFRVDGDTNTLNGITLTGFSRGSMNNIIVTNQGGHGIEFLSGNLASFQNIICLSNGIDGFNVNGTHDVPETNACVFSNLDCRGNSEVGFNIENGRNNLGLQIVCQSNGTYGIRVNDRSNTIFGYSESNTTKDYYLTNDVNTCRNTLHIMQGGAAELTDASTGNNTIYAEQCGGNQSGFEQILRTNSLQIPNWDYVGTLDFTHNNADREFSLLAGGTGADETLFFKNVNASYKLHLNVDGNITVSDGSAIGQAAGPLLTFDDTNNYLEISGCKVGIGTTTPVCNLDIPGATNNSSAKFGGLELQSYAVNNSWLSENVYYNSGYKYRANGFGIAMIFGDGSLDVRTAGNGSAGNTATLTSKFYVKNGGDILAYGTLNLLEKAAASADNAGYGQLWVKSDTPNTLWFTDDAGTDGQVALLNGVSGSFTTVDLKTVTVVNGLITSIV